MQIIAMKKTESVLLTLRTGEKFEVTMIQVFGEDASISTNIAEAVRIFNSVQRAETRPKSDQV